MSGSPSVKTEKNMSSRLLTMKFMQRAAASAAAKEPQSPAAGDGDVRAKRPRLSTEAEGSRTPQSDLEAISAALAVEEEKRREAIARQAAEAGESEWVLDIPTTPYTPQPIVLSAGSLDAEDDLPQGGRRAYGNFVRKKPSVSTAGKSSEANGDDEDDDDEEEEDEYETNAPNPADPDAVAAHIEKQRQKALAKEQRRKDAMAYAERKRLSGLTSISGSQKSTFPGMGSQSAKKKKKRKF